jgi:hypothetical protein
MISIVGSCEVHFYQTLFIPQVCIITYRKIGMLGMVQILEIASKGLRVATTHTDCPRVFAFDITH